MTSCEKELFMKEMKNVYELYIRYGSRSNKN